MTNFQLKHMHFLQKLLTEKSQNPANVNELFEELLGELNELDSLTLNAQNSTPVSLNDLVHLRVSLLNIEESFANLANEVTELIAQYP